MRQLAELNDTKNHQRSIKTIVNSNHSVNKIGVAVCAQLKEPARHRILKRALTPFQLSGKPCRRWKWKSFKPFICSNLIYWKPAIRELANITNHNVSNWAEEESTIISLQQTMCV